MTKTRNGPPEETPRAGTAAVDEPRRLSEIVRVPVRLPQDALRVEFRFGEDSTGAPAVWIVLVTRDDLKPSKAKVARQRAAEEVRAIVRSQSSRWPHVEIAAE